MPEWVLVVIMSVVMNGSPMQDIKFYYYNNKIECESMKDFFTAMRSDYDYLKCDLRTEWGV